MSRKPYVIGYVVLDGLPPSFLCFVAPDWRKYGRVTDTDAEFLSYIPLFNLTQFLRRLCMVDNVFTSTPTVQTYGCPEGIISSSSNVRFRMTLF